MVSSFPTARVPIWAGEWPKIGEELRADNTTVFYIHVAEGQPQEDFHHRQPHRRTGVCRG
jgi:hypothetical protein